MAGVLNKALGAPVTIIPQAGEEYVLLGIFRREPIEVATSEGEATLMLASSLKVRRDQADGLNTDDLVEPSVLPGARYRVGNIVPSASPADDGFLYCELLREEGEF
ncbi:hypothetical protein HFZ77_04450 [Thalassovita gelatinovora]|nr:hypothetical protein [Thalassovita gelatinovora]QIZ79782.1 hypothetical protein HFZ77_04450 [Thalassovita gelatinovora]